MAGEMSIKDLMGSEQENAKVQATNPESDMVEMDIADIKPYEHKIDPVQQNVDDLLDKMGTAVEDRIKRDEAFIESKMIEMEEDELDKSIEEDEDESEESSDDYRFEDLNDDIENAETSSNDEQLEAIKLTIKEKIKPITDAIDLSSFTISKKHVAVTKTLKNSNVDKHIADWVLLASQKPVSVSEFTGYEIEKLNPGSSSRNRYNTYSDIYTSIYNHIVDDRKPPFDIWLKNISFFDIPHLYFAVYKACFEGTNSIPYACSNKECNHVFMNDYGIEEMVKYKDESVKKIVADILTHNTNSEDATEYEVETVQISNNYVVGFREPTVWNIIFENAVLEEKFTDKYNEFLAILSYIDDVYYINRETNQLEPIQVEVDLNNTLKTVKSRVVKYSEVLKSLNSDQFQFLQSYIKKINDRYDGVTYKLPEVTCPKCGAVIKEQEMEPDQLLFTRHQLAAIAII